MEITIPLKLKYRNPARILRRAGIDPPEGTRVYAAGRFSRKASNSGTAQKAKQGNGHRRRSYNTHIAF